MYLYRPIQERLQSDELGYYSSYGIAVVNVHGNEIDRISDVSTYYDEVYDLCKRCTKMKLSPIHLRAVVDDFLAEI